MHMHHKGPSLSLTPCICTALRKASRAVTRAYDLVMEGTGMTVTQFAILRHLDRFGKLPLSRLAEAMVMDRTSLYRALAPLEREGWVIISSAGQRTKVATLSANGKVAMSNATGQWEYAQNAMLTAIGADEWRDLAVALGGIVSASQALPA